MKRCYWVIFGATLLALAGCSGSGGAGAEATGTAGTHDADIKAIQATEAAWVKDAGTRDVEKFAAYYTDDASVLLPNAPVFIGKDAIREGLKPVLSDPNFTVNWTATKIDVARSGDLGYSIGSYTMTVSDPTTKGPAIDKGKYMTVYRKQADGTWKSVADTFMTDSPVPAPAKK